ncbi:hypothetical protein [uncultured Bdellovibrio sp.]|uniref:hypothetical protein n=1 Tax=Bdellovibrio sp. HCB-162 TaxID=3394234 RepID=UPI0025E45D08|nr:hypothetical protein [uncultured Bdellovibrio sp.]
MKTFLFIFILSSAASAAIPPGRDNPEFIAPNESLTVLRGSTTLCTSESPMGGHRGLSFIQLGKGKCPQHISTPVGWDRPEEDPTSPGIPFKGRGL